MIKTHKETLFPIFNTIPEFIDSKSEDDHTLWNLLRDVNYIINKLIDDKILSKYRIDKLVEDYIFIEFIIKNELEYQKEKYFISQLFIMGIIEICEIYCLDNELYESCANLKTFKDLL